MKWTDDSTRKCFFFFFFNQFLHTLNRLQLHFHRDVFYRAFVSDRRMPIDLSAAFFLPAVPFFFFTIQLFSGPNPLRKYHKWSGMRKTVRTK